MRVPGNLAEFIATSALGEPYRQVDCLSTRELAKWLRDRNLGYHWTTLHRLWELGILHPIAVLEDAARTLDDPSRLIRLNLGGQSYFADLGVDFTEPPRFTPSGELDERLADTLLWHPFQLWSFDRLSLIVSGVTLAPGFFLADPESASHLIRDSVERAHYLVGAIGVEAWPHDFLKVLAVLLAAEPLVHTAIHQTFTYSVYKGESAEGYDEWINRYQGASIVNRAAVSVETLTEWHRKVAIDAWIRDPLESWRILIRHAAREMRTRFKGDALKSHDLYDHAEVLRRYLHTYHDVELDEEDVAGKAGNATYVRQERYGVARTSDFNRTAFRRIARDFGVDPQARVVLLLEGHTEVAFIQEYSEQVHFDLEGAGIELLNLNGTGGLTSDRTRELLHLFKRTEVFVFIAIDEDDNGKHIQLFNQYRNNHLALKDSIVWRPDFESNNFSVDELAAIATKMLHENGINSVITAASLKAEMAEHQASAGTCVVRLLNRARLNKQKGREWGVALGKWASDHACPASIQDEHGNRPVESMIALLRRGQSSDYEATFRQS